MSDNWKILTGDDVEVEAEELGVVDPGASAVARLTPKEFPRPGETIIIRGKAGEDAAKDPFEYSFTVGKESGTTNKAPGELELGHDSYTIDGKKVVFFYARVPGEEAAFSDAKIVLAVDDVTVEGAKEAPPAKKEPVAKQEPPKQEPPKKKAPPAKKTPPPQKRQPKKAPPPRRQPEPEPEPEPEPRTEPEPRDEPQPAAADPGLGEVLIQAEGLSKFYGGFTAIRDVTFEVRRGEVVAFLGPNGAGKSTTMRILTGVMAPDEGEARICGMSVIHNRIEVAKRLGFLPENGPLYEEMTPHELLWFLGEARGLASGYRQDRIDALTDRLALHTVMGKAIHKLSKGYRQRVALAQALLHEPQVLVMDEPTSGLDPNQIQDVRRIIRGYATGWTPDDHADDNKAILLSTHILQEVEAVADRVIFIHQGRIVFQGTVEELRRKGPALDDAFAAYTGYSASTWSS